MLGWTEADVLGQNASLFFTPEDQAAEAPATEMATARDYGRATDERWHVKKGGERFWANGPMMPLVDDETNVIEGYLKILRDRTEQRLAEEKTPRAKLSCAACLKARRLHQSARSCGADRVHQRGWPAGDGSRDFCAIQGRPWAGLWEDNGARLLKRPWRQRRPEAPGGSPALAKTLKGTPRWWDVQVTLSWFRRRAGPAAGDLPGRDGPKAS